MSHSKSLVAHPFFLFRSFLLFVLYQYNIGYFPTAHKGEEFAIA